MSRSGIHPLLMGLERPERKTQTKKLKLTGYESAQRMRFLRTERPIHGLIRWNVLGGGNQIFVFLSANVTQVPYKYRPGDTPEILIHSQRNVK